MSQDGEILREQEFGLKLPDGSIIWPPGQFHGQNFFTPADRQHILNSIGVSEFNLGFSPGQLIEQYGWVTRSKVVAIVYTDVAPALIPLAQTGYVPPPSVDEDVENPEGGA